jgi:hypothetical protein
MLAALGSETADGTAGTACGSPGEGAGEKTVTFPTLMPASCIDRQLGTVADQQIDLWRGHAAGFRGRALRYHLIQRRVGQIDARDRTQAKSAAPYVKVRHPLAPSCNVGNRDSLRPQTLRHADRPASPHLSSRRRHLGHDSSFENIGAVELPLDDHLQAGSCARAFSFKRTHAYQLGNSDLAPVNGELHGCERRDQRHRRQDQSQEEHAEKLAHC